MPSKKYQEIVDRIYKFVCDKGLLDGCEKRPHIGVALSGGADSVALLLVGLHLQWKVTALHCNFHLRGQESERDTKFVEELCQQFGVALKIVDFDTPRLLQQPANQGKSVEMICRDLRYDWFEKMADELRLDAVALGHHGGDNVETSIFNALRGSGLRGIKGIPARRGIFIRPLLGLNKEDILEIIRASKVGFVEDSTNFENHFQRNKIRNIILPQIERNFPGGVGGLQRSVEYLADDWELFESMIRQKRELYIDKEGVVNLELLVRNESMPVSLLFHLLQEQLDRRAVENLIDNLSNSGKFYTLSSEQRYLLDRKRLVPIEGPNQYPVFNIELGKIRREFEETGRRQFSVELPSNGSVLTIAILPREKFCPRRDLNFAWFSEQILDVEQLQLTPPHEGDRMQPFGMTGSRLVSDIFSDAKLPLTVKQGQPVLRSFDEILWLPGLKNSALYPVKSSDNNIIEFHLEKSE